MLSIPGETEEKRDEYLKSVPQIRLENNVNHIQKYSEVHAAQKFSDQRICSQNKCVRFSQKFSKFGWLEQSKSKVSLKYCGYTHKVENWLYCANSQEYLCYKEHKFKQNCRLVKTEETENPGFYFEKDNIFRFKEGKIGSEKFYLTEKERKEIVDRFHPKEENVFLKFIATEGFRYYLSGFHIIMWILLLLRIYNYTEQRKRLVAKRRKDKREKALEKEKSEEIRMSEIEKNIAQLRIDRNRRGR